MGTRHFALCPCSESRYFYSHREESIERRCIGRPRLDFGSGNGCFEGDPLPIEPAGQAA